MTKAECNTNYYLRCKAMSNSVGGGVPATVTPENITDAIAASLLSDHAARKTNIRKIVSAAYNLTSGSTAYEVECAIEQDTELLKKYLNKTQILLDLDAIDAAYPNQDLDYSAGQGKGTLAATLAEARATLSTDVF